MAAPKITVTGQTRLNRAITVYGYVTGTPLTSLKMSLPAAAVPNGAISRGEVDVALNVANEFVQVFDTLAYGNYDAPVITATNADGTTTAYGLPLMLPVPGTLPVGEPRAVFPALSVPVFNAPTLALGAEVVKFDLVSQATVNETSIPFTFGHPFPVTALKKDDVLVGRIAGEPDIPLQFNVKATHLDGSVRHAIISGKLPALAAGATKTVTIIRSGTGGVNTPATSASMTTATGFGAKIQINIAGTTYSVSVTNILNTASPDAKLWFGGSQANEYIINTPFIKDGTTEVHPHLTAQIAVRRYAGTNKYKFDVTVEHTKAYAAIADIAYTGTVHIGGVERLKIAAEDGVSDLVHFPCARWKRTFWWNVDKPVHVKLDGRYIMNTGAVPHYDPRVVIEETLLAGYVTNMSDPNFKLMGRGLITSYFPGTGKRKDLAVVPHWHVSYLVTQDKRAKDIMLAIADHVASFMIHRRDDGQGPGRGYAISVANYPRSTEDGTLGDSKNVLTGQYEKFPSRVSSNTWSPDSSHQGSFAYVPYLVTGDYFYLEEMEYWSSWNLHQLNPGLYRSSDRGTITDGQVRAQAWNIRTMAECAAYAPDDHYLKTHWLYFFKNTMSKLNQIYTDNPEANQLGVTTGPNGSQVIYRSDVGGTQYDGVRTGHISYPQTAIGGYQDDFHMQAICHSIELGLPEGTRFRNWKTKFQVGRMIAPGYCWNQCHLYATPVRPTETSPYFTDLAECMRYGLTPAMNATACNTQERIDQMNAERGLPSNPFKLNGIGGYAYDANGFATQYISALAMAVDANIYPDSDLAWDLIETRSVKPNYGREGMEFAIVPRTVPLTVVEPPIDDPDEPPPPPPPDEPEEPPPPPPPVLPGSVAPIDRYNGIAGKSLFFGRNS